MKKKKKNKGKSEKQNETEILAKYQICQGLKMKGMVLDYLLLYFIGLCYFTIVII